MVGWRPRGVPAPQQPQQEPASRGTPATGGAALAHRCHWLLQHAGRCWGLPGPARPPPPLTRVGLLDAAPVDVLLDLVLVHAFLAQLVRDHVEAARGACEGEGGAKRVSAATAAAAGAAPRLASPETAPRKGGRARHGLSRGVAARWQVLGPARASKFPLAGPHSRPSAHLRASGG